MTKINKMVMNGFKSFSKKTEVVFGDNFNCVLGPNGAGKSNIIDALCFVLGKSGSKGLRAEKTANLIYNGGKTKNPAKSGEVSIWFDNSQKTFSIEGEEIKVSRIVRHSGTSIYKINDKTATRQQILDLLSQARINPDSYNIILQGDIVRFVEMSPVDRRGIIEEIGGISIYEEKRQKALRQLEKVEERLNESDIILTERGVYLRELRKERDQAQKFKDLDDKIKSNKATMISSSMEERKNNAKKLKKQTDEAKKEIEKIDEEIQKEKEKIEKKKEEQTKINQEVEEKGDKEQVKIQKEVENIKIEHAKNKERARNLITEIDRIDQRIEQLEYGKKEHSEKLVRLQTQKDEIEKQIESNKSEQAHIDKKIEEFKKKHNLASAGDKEKEVEDIDKKADQAQEEIQRLRIEEQELVREKDRLDFSSKSIDEKMEKVLAVQSENKKELDRLRRLKEEFKKSTVELNTKLNEDSSFAAQLANARQKLLKTQEELSALQAKTAAITEKIAGGEAIKAIIGQKESIKGIHGTISELGKVKSEYSLALEVAAGARIRSIIVENDKVASQCISFLKEKQLGTATFLPLNKIRSVMKSERTAAALNADGSHGLAENLVVFDAKYKNAFSYVFGGAVVVDNIDIARRIGVGTCKMVTLDGDVTDVSGAMQGGYRKKTGAGGAFKEQGVDEDIKKKQEEISDLQNIVSTLDKRKTENGDAIERLRTTKATLEGEIIKIEKSLHLEDSDLDADKKSKGELEQKEEAVQKELFELQNKIGILSQELVDAKVKKQNLRLEINELKNPRLLAELNTFEQKKQELKDDSIKLEAETKSIDSQMETIITPEFENIQKIIKQHEKEKQEFLDERKVLLDKIKKQEGSIKEKEAYQKKFYSQFKELFNKREKIGEEINKIEQKVIRKEEEARRHEQKSNTVSLDLARIKAELAGLEEEFKAYEGVKIFKNKPEEEIKKEIAQFERMAQDIGAVNMKALEIYNTIEEEYNKLLDKKKKLAEEKEDVMLMMNEVEVKKKELFLNSFDVVNENFGKIFSVLSTKGEAFLVLEDEKDPFEGGVTISVKLTSRKFMDIRSLSGGEKTLTALAFIFCIQEHDPASFYILDEVDAALDKRNSEKLADLVRDYSKKAQYIMISHNDGVISEADKLYGVSMDKDGVSKVVTLQI